jgi:hypothetical protein
MKALDRDNTAIVPLSVAAMELRIAPAALYQCALRGEILITRTGRHWYCDRAELERFRASPATATRR